MQWWSSSDMDRVSTAFQQITIKGWMGGPESFASNQIHETPASVDDLHMHTPPGALLHLGQVGVAWNVIIFRTWGLSDLHVIPIPSPVRIRQ